VRVAGLPHPIVRRPLHSAGTISSNDAPELMESPCLANQRALDVGSPERLVCNALRVGSATWLKTIVKSASGTS
jgi:hypothetical protein